MGHAVNGEWWGLDSSLKAKFFNYWISLPHSKMIGGRVAVSHQGEWRTSSACLQMGGAHELGCWMRMGSSF